MWASTFLSPYLHPMSSALYSKLCKSPHQCGLRIGLYTLSGRWGLRMGCCIMKGVSEQCIVRLRLTILFGDSTPKFFAHFWIKATLASSGHLAIYPTLPNLTKIIILNANAKETVTLNTLYGLI